MLLSNLPVVATTAIETVVQGGVAQLCQFSNRNFKATIVANTAAMLTSVLVSQIFSSSNFVGASAVTIAASSYVGYKAGQSIDPQYNFVTQKLKVLGVLIPVILATSAVYYSFQDSYQTYLVVQKLSNLIEEAQAEFLAKGLSSTYQNITNSSALLA